MSESPAEGPSILSGASVDSAVGAVVAAVRAGECVVLPTDTVYGIGADAFSAAAVQRLLDAKHRGRDMPPPILIGDPTVLDALATDVPEAARRLAEAHWPGALTLILFAQPSLNLDLGETNGTVAVRVPNHDLARALLRATGPLAVSSANLSGEEPATDVQEAARQLGKAVFVYVDGGPTPGPVPSTIVDFTTGGPPRAVRVGLISVAALRVTIPELLGPDDREPGAPSFRAAGR